MIAGIRAETIVSVGTGHSEGKEWTRTGDKTPCTVLTHSCVPKGLRSRNTVWKPLFN